MAVGKTSPRHVVVVFAEFVVLQLASAELRTVTLAGFHNDLLNTRYGEDPKKEVNGKATVWSMWSDFFIYYHNGNWQLTGASQFESISQHGPATFVAMSPPVEDIFQEPLTLGWSEMKDGQPVVRDLAGVLSSGVLAPCAADEGKCNEGVSIDDWAVCTAKCGDAPFRKPSVGVLRCLGGTLDPPNFTCASYPRTVTLAGFKDATLNNRYVENVVKRAKYIDKIIDGRETYSSRMFTRLLRWNKRDQQWVVMDFDKMSMKPMAWAPRGREILDPVLLKGWLELVPGTTPAVTARNATAGVEALGRLTPLCDAPGDVAGAATPPCLGGSLLIEDGETCEARCADGASAGSLLCKAGVLEPPTFACTVPPGSEEASGPPWPIIGVAGVVLLVALGVFVFCKFKRAASEGAQIDNNFHAGFEMATGS